LIGPQRNQKTGEGWRRYRAEIYLSLRVTIAGVLTFILAESLHLPQAYWAVLTAVLVVQASLGASLKVVLERMVGTIGGAAYSVLVASVMPHDTLLLMVLTLAVALMPMAFLAALTPRFRIAPVTVVIVIFTSLGQTQSIILYALERVGEIGLGSLVGLGVSLLVLPERAHSIVTQTAGKTLIIFAQLLPTLMQGAQANADRSAIDAAYQKIRAVLTKLETAAQEARQERSGHLTAQADPEPLLQSIRRVRHDLVMIGRALAHPLPEEVKGNLAPPLAQLTEQTALFLKLTGEALAQDHQRPQSNYKAAFDDFAAAMAALRSTGQLRILSADAVGRVFALAFSLEQLQDNFAVLHEQAGQA
jgi:uncharacterized membrane protein YccC